MGRKQPTPPPSGKPKPSPPPAPPKPWSNSRESTLQSELSESQARVKFLEWRMRDLCKTLQTTHLNKADLVMLGMTLEEELEKP